RRGFRPTIIEKDFWVCWTIKRIGELPHHPKIVFKGGTSLSKVYGVIERFSEDIDLSFDRRELGFEGDRDPANAPSGKKKQERLDELDKVVTEYIAGTFRPQLAKTISTHLGREGQDWSLTLHDKDPQTLNFNYPQHGPTDSRSYIRRIARLELG